MCVCVRVQAERERDIRPCMCAAKREIKPRVCRSSLVLDACVCEIDTVHGGLT